MYFLIFIPTVYMKNYDYMIGTIIKLNVIMDVYCPNCKHI